MIVGYGLKCLGTSKIIAEGVEDFFFAFPTISYAVYLLQLCPNPPFAFPLHSFLPIQQSSLTLEEEPPLIPPACIRHSDSMLGIFIYVEVQTGPLMPDS